MPVGWLTALRIAEADTVIPWLAIDQCRLQNPSFHTNAHHEQFKLALEITFAETVEVCAAHAKDDACKDPVLLPAWYLESHSASWFC
jgi:hypothetical protein